jgi:hypothetical protein
MTQDFLSLYKRKVNRTIGNSLAPKEMTEKNYPDNSFDLYQRRLISQGMSTDPATRDIKLQKESLLNALNNSFDSERIKIVIDPTGESSDTDYMAVINELNVTWDSDVRSIAVDETTTPVDAGVTIDFLRTGFKYLTVFNDFNTKAFFSGHIERANYLIKWSDEKGIIYQQWAVVKGPVEKDTDFERARAANIDMDKGNNSFTITMGKSEAVKHLHRYDRIILKDASIGQTRAWIMDVIDDITNKYLVRITLREHYIDQVVDKYVEGIAYNYDERSTENFNEFVDAGVTAVQYIITSPNHGLVHGQRIRNDNHFVYVLYIDENNFSISYINDGIPIKLTNDFTPISYEYSTYVTDYVINGPDFIKKSQTSEYNLNNNTNRNLSLTSNSWFINGINNLSVGTVVGSVVVMAIDSDTIKLKPAAGATIGTAIPIVYQDTSNSIEITKNIKIVSPIS